jgi:hypothetical protein
MRFNEFVRCRYYKGQSASRIALCSNNKLASSDNSANLLFLQLTASLKRNTNTGEAGICWAKVVRPCIYEQGKIK